MSETAELFQRSVEMHRSGQLQAAAQGYAAVLRVDPGHADAWHLAGVLAHQSGRSSQAIECIAQAIARDSGKSEYHANLSAIYLVRGQWTAALESAERARELNPDSGVAAFQQGRALARLGHPQKAADAFEAAIARGFDPAQALLELGEVRQAQGELTASIQSLEKSLQHNPSQPAAWLSLSRMVATGDYVFSSGQTEQMEAMLKSGVGEKDRSRIAFALGAHYDRTADYDRAFAMFRTGNEAACRHQQVQGRNYDPQERTRLVDQFISCLTSDRLRRLTPASDSNRPILVIGMPRSGTSLIEQILASHPDVAAGGELAYWTRLFERSAGESARQFLEQLDDHWLSPAAQNYLTLLNQLAPGSTRVVDKMPGNYLYAGLIATAFPQATIIHCRRDPRDTCLSNYAQLFDDSHLQLATGDLSVLSRRYQDYHRIVGHWNDVLPGRIVDVFYEHLIQDPETQIRRLLKASRLAWSDECLNFHRRRQSVRTASVAQVRQPVYQSSRGRWSRYADQLRPLTETLRDCIAEYEALLSRAEIPGPG